MHLKISSAKWQPVCPDGDELISKAYFAVDNEVRWKQCDTHYTDVTGVTGHLKSQATQLLVQQQVLISSNIKALHYWPFVKGTHQRLVDSSHKGPMRKMLLLASFCYVRHSCYLKELEPLLRFIQ